MRAWAKQRRGEFGNEFEMHPATRRLLQGEVARAYPKRPRRRVRWGSFFSALRGRVAGLATLFVVLLITAWGAKTFWSSWTHSNDPKSLEASPPPQMWSLRKHPEEEAERLFAALNKPSNPPPTVVVTTAPPAAPRLEGRVPIFDTEDERSPAKTKPGDTEMAGARMMDPFSPASRAAAPTKQGIFNPIVPPLLLTGGVAALTESLAKKPSVASPVRKTGPSPLASISKPSPARPDSLFADQAAPPSPAPTMLAAPAAPATPSTGYSFAQIGGEDQTTSVKRMEAQLGKSVGGATAAEKRSDSTLSRFEIKREGAKIILLDTDGSVYEGQLLADDRTASPARLGAAQAPTARRLAPRGDAADAIAFGGPASATFSFRASGDSRTLRQPIVITATVSGPLPEASAMTFAADRLPAEPPLSPAAATSGPSAAKILFQGKLRIGTNAEQPLRAVQLR